jgi:hypothetical protein
MYEAEFLPSHLLQYGFFFYWYSTTKMEVTIF